jgi:hypothetical protein
MDWVSEGYFGYSSSYRTVVIGSTSGASSHSIAFGVDLTGNASGAFTGYGSEYVWRNAGSFITPNSGNNGYNTLLSWNSSGQLTVNQAATFSSSISGGSSIAATTYITAGTSITASTYLGVSRDGSDTIGSGPYLVLSQTANSRQWVQQMSASLSLNFYHYTGSAWIQPLTLAATGAATLTSSASSVISVISTSTDSRINIGHSGNGGYVGYANLGSGAAANTFYITTGSGSTTSGIRMNNDGNVTVAGTITESSSIRYKENIETLKYGLDKIVQLRGVTYNKKDTGAKEIGLIAEEVESILPDVILRNQEGEPDSVSYGRITAVLIEAIKELKMEIEELKRR